MNTGMFAFPATTFLPSVRRAACRSATSPQLWAWKAAITERLAGLRLIIHVSRAQVLPVDDGIPWLGFVVFPTHLLVKARKVRSAYRRLRARLGAYHAGEISFAELDASIQGWIAHVAHADSWGLRRHVLDTLVIRPAEHRRAVAARRTRHG
jgi:RNA-directed DNA polymerase